MARRWIALVVGWLVLAGLAQAQEPCPEEYTPPELQVSLEGLRLWLKPNSLPPLVTTGDPTAQIPGALGQKGTRIMFGNGDVDDQANLAARLTATSWLTDNQ